MASIIAELGHCGKRQSRMVVWRAKVYAKTVCSTKIKIKEQRPRPQKAAGRLQIATDDMGGVDCHHRQHCGVDAVAQPHDVAGGANLSQAEFFQKFQSNQIAQRDGQFQSADRAADGNHRLLLSRPTRTATSSRRQAGGSAVCRRKRLLDAGHGRISCSPRTKSMRASPTRC